MANQVENIYNQVITEMNLSTDEELKNNLGLIVDRMEELGVDYDDAWFYAMAPKSARDYIENGTPSSSTEPSNEAEETHEEIENNYVLSSERKEAGSKIFIKGIEFKVVKCSEFHEEGYYGSHYLDKGYYLKVKAI